MDERESSLQRYLWIICRKAIQLAFVLFESIRQFCGKVEMAAKRELWDDQVSPESECDSDDAEFNGAGNDRVKLTKRKMIDTEIFLHFDGLSVEWELIEKQVEVLDKFLQHLLSCSGKRCQGDKKVKLTVFRCEIVSIGQIMASNVKKLWPFEKIQFKVNIVSDPSLQEFRRRHKCPMGKSWSEASSQIIAQTGTCACLIVDPRVFIIEILKKMFDSDDEKSLENMEPVSPESKEAVTNAASSLLSFLSEDVEAYNDMMSMLIREVEAKHHTLLEAVAEMKIFQTFGLMYMQNQSPSKILEMGIRKNVTQTSEQSHKTVNSLDISKSTEILTSTGGNKKMNDLKIPKAEAKNNDVDFYDEVIESSLSENNESSSLEELPETPENIRNKSMERSAQSSFKVNNVEKTEMSSLCLKILGKTKSNSSIENDIRDNECGIDIEGPFCEDSEASVEENNIFAAVNEESTDNMDSSVHVCDETAEDIEETSQKSLTSEVRPMASNQTERNRGQSEAQGLSGDGNDVICAPKVANDDLDKPNVFEVLEPYIEIGEYRLDEGTNIRKGKKGTKQYIENLQCRKKVKRRGIPNRHINLNQELLLLDADNGDKPCLEEEEKVKESLSSKIERWQKMLKIGSYKNYSEENNDGTKIKATEALDINVGAHDKEADTRHEEDANMCTIIKRKKDNCENVEMTYCGAMRDKTSWRQKTRK